MPGVCGILGLATTDRHAHWSAGGRRNAAGQGLGHADADTGARIVPMRECPVRTLRRLACVLAHLKWIAAPEVALTGLPAIRGPVRARPMGPFLGRGAPSGS